MNNSYKCPKCNNYLSYNESSKLLKCENCNIEYKVPDNNIKNCYICDDCNSKVISSKNMDKCIYCKSSNITLDNTNFNTYNLIPYEIDEKRAKTILKKFYNCRIFKPSKFNLNNLNKIYMPYELCSYKISGKLNYSCNKITRFRTGGNRYNKIDSYMLKREAKIDISDCLIYKSSNIDENLVNRIGPYDINKIKQVDSNYLDEYIIELENKNNNDEINTNFSKEVEKSIKGYKDIKLIDMESKIDFVSKTSVLIPVYISNINYKGKKYIIAINGENGNISGYVPISKCKIFLLWIIIFVFVFIITFLLSYFKVIK